MTNFTFANLWAWFCGRDVQRERQIARGIAILATDVADNPDAWKRHTTMHHEKLVEDHLRLKAFLIAEKDGFRKDPAEYWEEAKRG